MITKEQKKGAAYITDWAFRSTGNGYQAPELCRFVLTGNVYKHPKHDEGKHVKTSSVTETQGRFVATRSGSVYFLGIVSKGYRKYLRDTGKEYNPKQPLTIITD